MAEERKRSFLRMVSHELRTPLNAIIGFSEIISRELYGPLSDPRYREQAEIIRDSGLKLLGLVNQVMEIARLEGGAADLDLRPEQPELALDEAMAVVQSEADAKGVELIIDPEGQIPLVTADPRALKTVYLNLLQNAVTASPAGGKVTAHLVRRAKSVIIEILDEGPGAQRGEIARLMRPFEQGENALTRCSEGAGLGLPIASLLCQAMGGRLRLSSEPGQGMRARVILPLAGHGS
jgi:signal transduction histidine kinase